MKITFVVSGSIRSNFTYRALTLAEVLSRRGHDVSIVAPSADKYNNFNYEKISSINGVGILQPFQFKTKRLEINLIPYIVGAAWFVFKRRSDVVYIYKPTPISIVGFVGKLFGAEIILDMDDLGSEVMRIEGHPAYMRILVSWCERFAARFCTRIVVASTYLKDMYTSSFPEKPIFILPNGVDSKWITSIVEPKIKPRIVFLGALNRKNILEPLIDVFPDVLTKNPHATLCIMGDGTYLEYFKNKVTSLGLASHIQFTGWLPLDEARMQLHAGDIGYNYMPDESTIKAASNMKVSQYMARGVVPLVSSVGDLPRTVLDGKAGYIALPDNLQDLTSVLLSALSDPQRKEKSLCAQEYARTCFDWNTLGAGFDGWLSHRSLKKEESTKKIYVIATEMPANVGGAPLRNYHLIRQLAKDPLNHIEVFTTRDVPQSIAPSVTVHVVHRHMSTLWTKFVSILIRRVQPFMYEFDISGLGDSFKKACEQSMPDVVHIEQITGYYCVRKHILWLQKHGVKVVLDAHNIEAEAFSGVISVFSGPKKIVGKILLPQLRRIENEAVRRMDLILACSTLDADYFKQFNSRVHVVPNGVDCDEFQPSKKTNNHDLIFIGGVAYPPNADGLQFYLKEIHPLVREKLPNARILAIGATKEWLSQTDIGFSQDDSIVPLGFVDDIKPYLAQAQIGICPIRLGSGTRIKILTYMAAGLPVVSTSKGAEGVVYTNNKNIVITDTPQQYADEVVGLLSGGSIYESMARNARAFVLEWYDWNLIGRTLNDIYRKEL